MEFLMLLKRKKNRLEGAIARFENRDGNISVSLSIPREVDESVKANVGFIKDGFGVQFSSDDTALKLTENNTRLYLKMPLSEEHFDLLPVSVRNSSCYRFCVVGEKVENGYAFMFKNLRMDDK